MIILSDTLWVAEKEFTSGASFDRKDWYPNPDHNYAEFNVFHTWTEAINRYLGAILGFLILIVNIFALKGRRIHKAIFPLAFVLLLLIGFEAWLGKTVVNSNLAPFKITIHMVGSLIIVMVHLVLMMIIRKHAGILKPTNTQYGPRLLRFWLGIALLISIIQVLIGTQVRESVDILLKTMDIRGHIPQQLGKSFNLHRLLAYLIVAVNAILVLKTIRSIGLIRPAKWIIFLIVAEFITGLCLYHFGLPPFLQPIHLLLAALTFGIQFNWLLHILSEKKQLAQ